MTSVPKIQQQPRTDSGTDSVLRTSDLCVVQHTAPTVPTLLAPAGVPYLACQHKHRILLVHAQVLKGVPPIGKRMPCTPRLTQSDLVHGKPKQRRGDQLGDRP